MVPRTYARKELRPELTVRQTVHDFPATKAVFLRHGEEASPPSRFGHLEPLAHFAQRRGIPMAQLLDELSAATGEPIVYGARIAERIHHGFILSALIITLTLGAGWGAWLLWQISLQGNFATAPAASIIAHGEAQLWGFIVLFVMGVSLRTVLFGAVRMPGGVLICRSLLTLALIGVGGGMVWSFLPQTMAAAGVASSVALLILATGYWALQFLLLKAKWRVTWVRAVWASGFWLTAWAVVTAWLRWKAGDAGPGTYHDSERLLLIELAVFGFGMNSIYGFGQMLLPGLLRIGTTRDWALELGHWLHNAGTLAVCLAKTSAAGSISMVVGSVLLVAGAIMFGIGNRGFVGRRRTSHGHEKGHAPLDYYPPLAFAWLLVALVLMTAGVVWEAITQTTLSHAYMGAVRHALTVGFMTTLILGVGQRMLPVFDRTVLAYPRLTVPILLLIGIGNLYRVVTEFATLQVPAAYLVMPYSALFEWTALLLFTINLSATMYHRDPLITRGRVTKRSSLAVLVGEYPWIEDRLRPIGTRYLSRARSVPDELTIGSFSESEGVAADELVSYINTWIAQGPEVACDKTWPADSPEEFELELAKHRR